MATVKDNEPQLSAVGSAGTTQGDPALAPGPVPEGDAGPFTRGQSRGRELADEWRRRFSGWAEENPGQMIAAGLVLGFVAGKIFRRPRRVEIDLDR